MKSFASDNYSGVHPKVMEALIAANKAHQISYGEDEISLEVKELFQKEFGDLELFFTFNGTGANIVSLRCATLPFQSIVCTDTAHIAVDECGGPAQSIGCTLETVESPDGKLTPDLVAPLLAQIGNVHHTQPKVISISQTTELGTVYSIEELKALADFAHANDMYLHMDGARISNAVASLNCSLREATVDCGVDIMSFGGTKNGIMMGEAILIFNKELRKHAAYYHKQSAQLFSKNRFIAVQFKALLENELWRELALHSNRMAQLLYNEVSKIEGVNVTQSVDANALFVTIPSYAVEPLRKDYRFYDWNTETGVLRWMCSFDTTEEEVMKFASKLRELIKT